jgi:hypothetical protein
VAKSNNPDLFSETMFIEYFIDKEENQYSNDYARSYFQFNQAI